MELQQTYVLFISTKYILVFATKFFVNSSVLMQISSLSISLNEVRYLISSLVITNKRIYEIIFSQCYLEFSSVVRYDIVIWDLSCLYMHVCIIIMLCKYSHCPHIHGSVCVGIRPCHFQLYTCICMGELWSVVDKCVKPVIKTLCLIIELKFSGTPRHIQLPSFMDPMF